MAKRGKRADNADPSGVTGAYTNANSDTRLPTVTSDTFKPAAISGRMPTTMNSLMPSMKLSEISTITGRLKNRSFATSLFAIHFSSIAPRTPHALPNSHCH